MKTAGTLLFWMAIGPLVIAQSDVVRQKNYNIRKGIVMEGYDPVSYFDNHPLEGKSEFHTSYRGVAYQFASAINLKKFTDSPDKYEPAFGGWCAYAMGESGEKVKIDPETFKFVDGKLYLFYNFWGTNTLTSWNKNESALKAKGEENWKRFVP